MTTYRTGNHQPRNLYRGDAALVVEALNEVERLPAPARPIVVERGRIHPDGPVHPGPGLLRRLGDAPPGRAIQPQSAADAPGVGRDRADALADSDGFCDGRDCNHGEPERKADQA